MDYGMIGKIEKAKRYAEERDRILFTRFTVTFDGDNNRIIGSYPDLYRLSDRLGPDQKLYRLLSDGYLAL